MGQKPNSQSFWTTLPGILTGLAALLTAIGGLITASYATGLYKAFIPNATPAAAASTLAPAGSTSVPQAQPASLPVLPTPTPNLWPTAVSNPLGQPTSTANATFQIIADWGDTATSAGMKISIDNVFIGSIQGNGRLQYATSPGSHSYYVYAEATLKDGTKYSGEGKGSFDVKQNAEYIVRTATDARVLIIVPK